MRSNYILLSSRIIYHLSYILYTCRRIEDFCLDKKQLFAGGWLAGALLQMASGCPLMVSGSEKVWVLILQQWDSLTASLNCSTTNVKEHSSEFCSSETGRRTQNAEHRTLQQWERRFRQQDVRPVLRCSGPLQIQEIQD